jgi:hypothetical protein
MPGNCNVPIAKPRMLISEMKSSVVAKLWNGFWSGPSVEILTRILKKAAR